MSNAQTERKVALRESYICVFATLCAMVHVHRLVHDGCLGDVLASWSWYLKWGLQLRNRMQVARPQHTKCNCTWLSVSRWCVERSCWELTGSGLKRTSSKFLKQNWRVWHKYATRVGQTWLEVRSSERKVGGLFASSCPWPCTVPPAWECRLK